MRTQHFESMHDNADGVSAFCISPMTEIGIATHPCSIWIFVERNEQSQACVNRIVDNLNKLAGLRQ